MFATHRIFHCTPGGTVKIGSHVLSDLYIGCFSIWAKCSKATCDFPPSLVTTLSKDKDLEFINRVMEDINLEGADRSRLGAKLTSSLGGGRLYTAIEPLRKSMTRYRGCSTPAKRFWTTRPSRRAAWRSMERRLPIPLVLLLGAVIIANPLKEEVVVVPQPVTLSESLSKVKLEGAASGEGFARRKEIKSFSRQIQSHQRAQFTAAPGDCERLHSSR